jgi:hypothetical protein
MLKLKLFGGAAVNKTTRLRLGGYGLILLAALLGYFVRQNPDAAWVTPVSVVSSVSFMAGALLALQAILQRIKDRNRDRNPS